MPYTADDLVTQVRRGGMIPDASTEITAEVILAFLDEESRSVIAPWRRKLAGTDYRIDQEDQSIVAGTSTYRIPWRAEAGALRDVLYVDASGDAISLDRIPLHETDEYLAQRSPYWAGPYGFCVEGDFVRLLPTPTTTGTLRLKYPRRPSRLVARTDAMLITNIVVQLFATTYSGAEPDLFSAVTPLDIVQANPNFDLFARDVLPASVSTGSSVTFATSPSAEVAPGDYLALAGETPVVQLPVELHPVLVALGVARALEADGDREGANAAYERGLVRLQGMEALFTPRVEAKPRKSVNRASMLRGGGRR